MSTSRLHFPWFSTISSVFYVNLRPFYEEMAKKINNKTPIFFFKDFLHDGAMVTRPITNIPVSSSNSALGITIFATFIDIFAHFLALFCF